MGLRHSIPRLALATACLSLFFQPLAQTQPGPARWITTWTTSNAASDQPTTFSNQTIREVVHTSIGGSAVRIRLSNTFGPRAIRFDAVAVGLQQNGASLVPHSNHEVTFGGSRSIAIPEGAEVLSDPVELSAGPEQNLAISLFTAGDTGPATGHWLALQTNYVSGAGNFSADEGGSGFSDSAGAKAATSWYFLSAVEVQTAAGAKGARRHSGTVGNPTVPRSPLCFNPAPCSTVDIYAAGCDRPDACS